MNYYKKTGRLLKKAGAQVRQAAQEVLEDCDNEVLRNAREYYTGAAEKVQKGISHAVKTAESCSEDGDAPETLNQDLTDTAVQMKQLAKEVAADCDNETLRGAGAFYSRVYHSAQAGMKNRLNRARERSERRKSARAAARRRRAAIRSKLKGKAAAVMICLILILALAFSAAVWFSQHHGTQKEAPQKTAYETAAKTEAFRVFEKGGAVELAAETDNDPERM